MRLVAALGLEAARVISIVGSGGKTTLMFAAAREFVAAGERVLLTTTTKIARHEAFDGGYALVMSDAESIVEDARRAAQARGAGQAGAMIACVGESADGQKIIGFPPGTIDRLRDDGHFDRILVEADGSARKPLKAPAAHEPVIPSSTDVLIMVAGLNGLGFPLDETTVFRAERWAELTGAKAGSCIDAESVSRVVLHEGGLGKGCPERALRALFLNRAHAHPIDAERIIKKLSQGQGGKLGRIVSGSLLPKPDILEVVSFETVSMLVGDAVRTDGRGTE